MEKKDFPEILYVCKEDNDHGHNWFEAEADPHNLAAADQPRRPVGIYRLVGTGEVVTGVTVEQEEPIKEDG